MELKPTFQRTSLLHDCITTEFVFLCIYGEIFKMTALTTMCSPSFFPKRNIIFWKM